MKLSVFGAAGEVTGSCYLVETAGARVLVDMGMFQGEKTSELRNREKPLFDPARLDAVVITHAHIDHIGRVPLLPRHDCRATLWATPATCELAPIMLRDSAHLQEADAEGDVRRAARRGEIRTPDPLYTLADVERVLPMFHPLAFDTPREIAPGVCIRFVDAGHILGSASVVMTVREGASTKTIAFSGDIGVSGAAVTRDPTPIPHADVVVMESTYGDRDHRPLPETVAELEEIIKHAVWSKQRVLLPAFAVGRTQTLMYHLADLGRSGRVPEFPVYLDSPMGNETTALYRKYRGELDEQTKAVLAYAESPGAKPSFRFTASAEESRKLNDFAGCAVIIAASGMCTGGRILHHLKHHVWRRDTHVVICGYQGEGTLGRRLVDGAKLVRILGEWIPVRATINTLGGFSAHAGQTELLAWAKAWAADKPRVILTHGEDNARGPLRDKLRALGLDPALPRLAESFEF